MSTVIVCYFVPLLLLTSSGCTGGGARIPEGWQTETVTFDQFSLENDVAVPLETGPSDRPGRLQIIICYGSLFSDHTALRLVSTNHDTVFWDPAGTYGVRSEEVARQSDLLIEGTPGLESYWGWRQSPCHNKAIEIFEWTVPKQLDTDLDQILRDGLSDDDPRGSFSTMSHGMLCCVSVSGFLKRFTPGFIEVPRTMFWPHELAAQLRTQRPDAVFILRAGEDYIEMGRP
ncbi:MAG: hypothetical protein HND57_01400 [Planctomycetes bacterium]|nr:hypothetical protein [Planctomycetota bacterium]